MCTGKFAAWHAAHTGSYDGIVVRRVVAPHRRDHDPADAGLVGEPLDLGDRAVDVVADRHEPDAGAPLGLVAHSSTRKRLCARAPANASSGSSIIPAERPAPNGGDSMPGDRVGVGEDHLGRDAVGVHLLVALLGVERAAQTFFVRRSPSGDVVVVQLHLLVAVRLALGEELVELRRCTAASRYGRYSSHGSPACASAEMIV